LTVTRADPDAEAKVLAALESGDRRRALTLLMDAYGAVVYRFCRAAAGDAATADDTTQTVFLKAFQALPRFGRRSTLLTWLLGIAHHTVLDAVRAKQRWWRRIVSTVPQEIIAPEPDAAQVLAFQARSTFMLDCLQALPAQVRVAVILRCHEGLSYEDMARMVRERAGTLQARVSRALSVLRVCVEGKERGGLGEQRN
jgi:RNA polymerase sigma factor (sigma-70 family)